MKDCRDLKVWSKAHELTLAAYKATSAFPNDEKFGLTSQIRNLNVQNQPTLEFGSVFGFALALFTRLRIIGRIGEKVDHRMLIAKC